MGLLRLHERYTTTFKDSFVVGICVSCVIGLVVELKFKVKILHIKNTPDFWILIPNKSRVFIALGQKVYSFFMPTLSATIRTFTVVVVLTVFKAIMPQGLIQLILQPQIIRDHGDKLRVGWFSSIILNSIAEIRIERIHVAPVPGHLDGVADGTLHAACGGLVFLRHAGVENLANN